MAQQLVTQLSAVTGMLQQKEEQLAAAVKANAEGKVGKTASLASQLNFGRGAAAGGKGSAMACGLLWLAPLLC